jgi:hypothetical protein
MKYLFVILIFFSLNTAAQDALYFKAESVSFLIRNEWTKSEPSNILIISKGSKVIVNSQKKQTYIVYEDENFIDEDGDNVYKQKAFDSDGEDVLLRWIARKRSVELYINLPSGMIVCYRITML